MAWNILWWHECSHTYNKPWTWLGNSCLTRFHLNWPFSLDQWAPQIWLLWWNASQCVSGSNTPYSHGVYCDGMRVLSNCSDTYAKPWTWLGNSFLTCFHLNSPFSLSQWAPQIWLLWWNASECVNGSSTRWFMKYIVIVWECCQTVLIPLPSVEHVWVTVVWLVSTSTHHSPSTSGPLRLGFCDEMLATVWVVLTHGDWMEYIAVVWECCQTVLIPIISLEHVWVTVV